MVGALLADDGKLDDPFEVALLWVASATCLWVAGGATLVAVGATRRARVAWGVLPALPTLAAVVAVVALNHVDPWARLDPQVRERLRADPDPTHALAQLVGRAPAVPYEAYWRPPAPADVDALRAGTVRGSAGGTLSWRRPWLPAPGRAADAAWELQRQTFLQAFVARWSASGDPQWLDDAARIAGTWRDGTPAWPLHAVKYAWNDEAASTRVEQQLALYAARRRAGRLDDDEAIAFLRSAIQHGDWAARDDVHNFVTNHGLFQDGALLSLALAFPELNDAGAWEDRAVARCRRYLAAAVAPDGTFRELSPGYHEFAARKVSWFAATLIAAGREDPEITATARRMLATTRRLAYPDGTLPAFGDTSPPPDVAGWPWDAVPDWPEAEALRTAEPAPPGVYVTDGGYVVFRSPDAPVVTVLLAGRLTLAHFQPDKLAIAQYAGGRQLAGPGYASGWLRERGVGTRQQNTVSVDGRDQPPGDAEIVASGGDGTFGWVTARHALYPGVTHTRTLVVNGAGDLWVRDHVVGDTPHDVEASFGPAPITLTAEAFADGARATAALAEDGGRVRFGARGREVELYTHIGPGTADPAARRGTLADHAFAWDPEGRITPL